MAKTYDEILQAIITDMRNTPLLRTDGSYAEPGVSKGSILYIIAVALAGCVWGLYKLSDWILRQMFAATANDDNVIRHAANVGLSLLPGETIDELKVRYFLKRRSAQITGNTDQYRLWALSVEGVKDAWVIPQGLGLGTILIYIIARTDDEIPSQELLDAVYAAVTDSSVVNVWQGRVFVQSLTFIKPDISIEVVTETPEAVATAVRQYLAGFDKSQALVKYDIVVVLYAMGLTQPEITFVVNDIEVEDINPGTGEIIRAGVIKVNGVEYV